MKRCKELDEQELCFEKALCYEQELRSEQEQEELEQRLSCFCVAFAFCSPLLKKQFFRYFNIYNRGRLVEVEVDLFDFSLD